MNNEEWCYVDSSYSDQRKWGFCVSIMDYDRVRGANLNTLKELTKITSSMNSEISLNVAPAKKSFDDLKKVRHSQETLENKINKMIKVITVLADNIQKLLKTKDQSDTEETKINEVFFKIEARKRELEQKKLEEEKNPALAKKTTNCNGLLLYEDIEDGDGLIAYYYDNENWLGSYIETKQPEINFDWTDSIPIAGVNPNNFSVIWDGWLFPPVTAYYGFAIECDDGAQLWVDNELLITHKLGSLVDGYKYTLSMKTGGGEDSGNQKINPNKSSIFNVHLIAATKVKITVKYFHSVHTSVNNNSQVFMRLFWQSEETMEHIIPTKYLYSAYSFNPLKITGFRNDIAKLTKLHENDYAFLNSVYYILQDIPPEFLNTSILKLPTRYIDDSLNVQTTGPTNVYIALLAHYPNPLPDDFDNTGISMSLLQLDKNQSKGSKKLIAKKSSRLIIYKKMFNKGAVQIKFKKFGINMHGIPMIVFFGFDSSSKSPLKCAGKEFNISLSTGRYFKKCLASSEKPNFKCEDGFSGKMRDEEGGMWAANSDGKGAWVLVKLNGIFKLTKIEYRNRKNPSERNAQLEITYSGGETQNVFLKNDDEIHTIYIDSVRASSVKVTIKEVYSTINNGGSFNIFGLRCTTDDDYDEDEPSPGLDPSIIQDDKPLDPFLIASLFEKEKRAPILLSCRDSLSNSFKFDNVKLKNDKKITVKCPESCAMTETPIYGTVTYTKDSAICKAAYHDGKISSNGGLVNNFSIIL